MPLQDVKFICTNKRKNILQLLTVSTDIYRGPLHVTKKYDTMMQ